MLTGHLHLHLMSMAGDLACAMHLAYWEEAIKGWLCARAIAACCLCLRPMTSLSSSECTTQNDMVPVEIFHKVLISMNLSLLFHCIANHAAEADLELTACS